MDPGGLGLRAEADPASPWCPSGPIVTGLFGIAARLLGQTLPTVRYSSFVLGGQVTSYAEYASKRWDAFSLYLTPATPEHTWIFYESTRTRFPLRAGDPLQRSFMKRIIQEGERETSLIVEGSKTSGADVSVESDRVSLAARRLYCQGIRREEQEPSADGRGGTPPSGLLP